MTDKTPEDGPLTARGPFIKNAQPIGHGFFLCEGARGTMGTAKVWKPTIVRANPNFGKPHKWAPNRIDDIEWQEVADVGVAQGKYTPAGTYKAVIHGECDDEKRRYVEGTFPDELEAVQFIVRNVPEIFR